jgi:amino acid adenylation domain-containing protein
LTPEELSAELESSGIVLAAEDGRLRVNAPRGALSEEMKTAIARSRNDLLALLERRALLQSAAIARIERSSVLPVSSFQERMWILQRIDPTNTDYNIVSVWQSATQFAADRQSAAVRSLIARHEILHSAFDEFGDSIGMQPLTPEAVPIEVRDLSAHPQTQRHELVRSAIDQEAHRPFDLTAGPAVRFIVCRLGESEAVTLCVAHHIAVDAWSLSLLEKEFAALCAQGTAPISIPSLQYADYAAWQRSRQNPRAMAVELQWWRGYLAAAPPLSIFPPDRSGSTGPKGATQAFHWDADLASGLRALARNEGATVYTALLAACAVVLRWHTGQQDFVLGSPTGVRERVELETMIGPFVGLLLIRLDVSGDPSFAEVLRHARDSMLEAHAHRQMPFEALLEHLKPPRMIDHSPVFQIAVVQHNAPGGEQGLSFSGGTMHELTWFVREAAGRLYCDLEFRADRYSDAAIDRIAAHLEAVLRQAVDKPGSRISELTQLVGTERRQVVEEFNSITLAVPDESFVAHFERRTAAMPDATAIVYQDARLSYAELNRRANALAQHLCSIGVARGTRVAVCLERSLELVVAVLAIQKTGAAYVPLDPGFPADRLSFMLDDSGAAWLLSAGAAANGVALPAGVAVVDCGRHAAAVRESMENPQPMIRAQDPAYVIYTSGSTGRPKGVIVSHGSLMNLLWSMAREPGLASTDVLAAVTTISFDIAGLELYLPLLVGARIELISRDDAANGAALAARLAQCGASVLQATPATWRLLIEADWRPGPGFRALCGGESLGRELADALLDRVAALWNLYGPTETTIWSSVGRVQRDDGPISIGRPIGNTQIYILGDAGQPMPIGVQGEICIGGAGVALGYHNRPELTGERFVADPFAARPDARLYRTGDLGRWREDGCIEHLGRIDHQVKIRGFRVELGEIEARLTAHEAVRQAVVVAREAAPGDLRVIAYVLYERAQDLTASEVRRHLRRDLPDYMVPSLVMAVESIPLTPNGKVDRAALPDPFKHTGARAIAHARLTTPMEELIGEFWRELLKVEQIGAEDNFFDLGGHSLLSLRVAASIERRTGWRMDPRTLYFQSLRQIAATVGGGATSSQQP